jgi:prepilin-type N-terminal cleavage/methylation domain-containing protein
MNRRAFSLVELLVVIAISLKGEDKAAHLLADVLHAKYNSAFHFSDLNTKRDEWLKANQPSVTGTNISSQK